MNFSVNQNRQFYVVKIVDSDSTMEQFANKAPGTLKVTDTEPDTPYVSFLVKNATNEVVRTDLINVNCIKTVSYTDPRDTTTKFKSVIVSLNPEVNNGQPILGEDYVVRIVLRNYFGMSDDTDYIKDVAVHVTKAMTSSSTGGTGLFFATLKKELEKSFSREIECPFTFAANGAGLRITAKPCEWHLGTMKEENLNFDVYTTEVTCDGEDVIWGTITNFVNATAESSPVANIYTTNTDGTEIASSVVNTYPSSPEDIYNKAVMNSQKIADLEYFCMGERADQYRNVCWPKVIPTKYMVEIDKYGYYVLDIHYAYIGDGMENLASEKTMTFVSKERSNLDDILTALVNAGMAATKVKRTQYTKPGITFAPEED